MQCVAWCVCLLPEFYCLVTEEANVCEQLVKVALDGAAAGIEPAISNNTTSTPPSHTHKPHPQATPTSHTHKPHSQLREWLINDKTNLSHLFNNTVSRMSSMIFNCSKFSHYFRVKMPMFLFTQQIIFFTKITIKT